MNYNLLPKEEEAIDKFMLRPEVQRALANGGRFALVFGPHTGIGVPVTATVQDKHGNVYSEDVTDIGAW